MSELDTIFAFFVPSPPPAAYMDATLTATRLDGLGLVATVTGAVVTYASSPAPTIQFDAKIAFDYPSGLGIGKNVHVLLVQNPGPHYGMTITFPKRTVNSNANIDAMSGVAYGSEGVQFVTLVMKVGGTQS